MTCCILSFVAGTGVGIAGLFTAAWLWPEPEDPNLEQYPIYYD